MKFAYGTDGYGSEDGNESYGYGWEADPDNLGYSSLPDDVDDMGVAGDEVLTDSSAVSSSEFRFKSNGKVVDRSTVEALSARLPLTIFSEEWDLVDPGLVAVAFDSFRKFMFKHSSEIDLYNSSSTARQVISESWKEFERLNLLERYPEHCSRLFDYLISVGPHAMFVGGMDRHVSSELISKIVGSWFGNGTFSYYNSYDRLNFMFYLEFGLYGRGIAREAFVSALKKFLEQNAYSLASDFFEHPEYDRLNPGVGKVIAQHLVEHAPRSYFYLKANNFYPEFRDEALSKISDPRDYAWVGLHQIVPSREMAESLLNNVYEDDEEPGYVVFLNHNLGEIFPDLEERAVDSFLGGQDSYRFFEFGDGEVAKRHPDKIVDAIKSRFSKASLSDLVNADVLKNYPEQFLKAVDDIIRQLMAVKEEGAEEYEEDRYYRNTEAAMALLHIPDNILAKDSAVEKNHAHFLADYSAAKFFDYSYDQKYPEYAEQAVSISQFGDIKNYNLFVRYPEQSRKRIKELVDQLHNVSPFFEDGFDQLYPELVEKALTKVIRGRGALDNVIKFELHEKYPAIIRPIIENAFSAYATSASHRKKLQDIFPIETIRSVARGELGKIMGQQGGFRLFIEREYYAEFPDIMINRVNNLVERSNAEEISEFFEALAGKFSANKHLDEVGKIVDKDKIIKLLSIYLKAYPQKFEQRKFLDVTWVSAALYEQYLEDYVLYFNPEKFLNTYKIRQNYPELTRRAYEKLIVKDWKAVRGYINELPDDLIEKFFVEVIRQSPSEAMNLRKDGIFLFELYPQHQRQLFESFAKTQRADFINRLINSDGYGSGDRFASLVLDNYKDLVDKAFSNLQSSEAYSILRTNLSAHSKAERLSKIIELLGKQTVLDVFKRVYDDAGNLVDHNSKQNITDIFFKNDADAVFPELTDEAIKYVDAQYYFNHLIKQYPQYKQQVLENNLRHWDRYVNYIKSDGETVTIPLFMLDPELFRQTIQEATQTNQARYFHNEDIIQTYPDSIETWGKDAAIKFMDSRTSDDSFSITQEAFHILLKYFYDIVREFIQNKIPFLSFVKMGQIAANSNETPVVKEKLLSLFKEFAPSKVKSVFESESPRQVIKLLDRYFAGSSLYYNSDEHNRIIDEEIEKYIYDFFEKHYDLISANEVLLTRFMKKFPKIAEHPSVKVGAPVFRAVQDYEVATKLYPKLRNEVIADKEVELEDHIKLSKSPYQTEQRPSSFRGSTRFELSQNNINPPKIIYDIGKKLIHAGDGVNHTNVGISGFTSAWALVSMQDDKLVVEQYQSDYPVVLDRLFLGNVRDRGWEADQGVTHSFNNEGKDMTVYNSLVSQYGEEAALDAKRHFARVTANYMFLCLINVIKLAQSLGLTHFYMMHPDPEIIPIQSSEKAEKLYVELPSQIAVGTEKVKGVKCYKIPATGEVMEKLRERLEDPLYNYSLTPEQNRTKKVNERLEKKVWRPSDENIEKLQMLRDQAAELLPEYDIPQFTDPTSMMRYLNSGIGAKLKGKELNDYLTRIRPVLRELGKLSRAFERNQRMIKIAKDLYLFN